MLSIFIKTASEYYHKHNFENVLSFSTAMKLHNLGYSPFKFSATNTNGTAGTAERKKLELISPFVTGSNRLRTKSKNQNYFDKVSRIKTCEGPIQ